jgi:hypothetical protein
VTEVDLRVADLLDEEPAADGTQGSGVPGEDGSAVRVSRPEDAGAAGSDEVRAAGAALAVPGVTGLTGVLGGPGGRAVHIEERPADGGALPRRHVRVEIAVAADRRAVEVARAVRSAVAASLRDGPTVAVSVTAVERPGT